MRVVRGLWATPRCTAWRIHHVAYVENLNPRRQSNFSTARMRPMIPSWIRSSREMPWPWYFFAIDTTRRRFEFRSELEPTAPVELLHGTDEADDPLLDQVEQRDAVALVLLRDRHDQAEVRVQIGT